MADIIEQYELHNTPVSEKSSETQVRKVVKVDGSDRDRVDLARWGKQERLNRIFSSLSTISLTCCVTMTWEVILGNFAGGLTNGGPAGLSYAFLYAWFGSMLQTLVLSELASMIPLAGGQYHWVAILAPPRVSRFLSYLTGWMTLLSWHCGGVVATAYIAGSTIQGLLRLNDEGYSKQLYQTYLILIAIIALAVFVNTTLIRLLPSIESGIFLVHVVGFFTIIVPLLYYAPQKASAREVFTTFYNGGNWPTMGISWFVGLGPTMAVFTGVDAASHIAEEVRCASVTIPKSMLISQLINGATGFAMVLAVLLCIQDLDAVLSTPTAFPYIQVFFDATRSYKGATAMVSLVVAALIFCVIGCLATSSRMIWALARENALPSSRFLARLHPRAAAPLNAVIVSASICCLLGLIGLGSEVAFYAFLSIAVFAFNGAFCISASVLLYRRLQNEEIQYGPFNLGRFGVPIIVVALAHSIMGTFFSFWPPTVNPTPKLMNWSALVSAGFMLISVGFWYLHGRRVYKGPIIEVELKERPGC